MNHVSCPRCGGALWGRALPAGAGHACGTCGGIWLDNAAASRVTETLCSDTLGHAEMAARTAQHAVDPRHPLACPSCGTQLSRTTIGQSRVEIDYCANHGTWFDRDELHRVAQSYATARAYGGHGSGMLLAGGVAGAAVAGTAVAGTAVAMAAQNPSTLERYTQNIDGETVADVAIEGGSAAFEVGAAVGDVVDAGEVAGGVFEIIGALFEGLG